MKKIIILIFTILILAIFAGCPSPYDSSVSDSLYGKNTLPADSKYDIARSSGSEFTFETLFPVRVKLDVTLYGLDSEGTLLSDPLPPDSAEINVTLIDKRGAAIYSGKASSSGSLLTTVYLPSAPEDVTLKLQAAGFEDRQVVISNMVRYREINRTMAMKKYVSGSRSALRSLPFSDPYPDPVLNVPEITIAFEDLFGNARAGDADYNDFIASYTISETMDDATGFVKEIHVEARAVRKWAGYDHLFGIRIDSFEGTADISGTYIDSSGASVPFTASGSTGPLEIVLFERSTKAVGKTAAFTIEFQTLQITEPEQAGVTGAALLSRPPYNPYIYVYNTKKDIHLIDREPLSDSQNLDPDDRFVDGEGFPWALLVPSAWESPAEGQRIEVAYPRFENWRLSDGDLHGDWYNYPGEPYVEDPDPPLATAEMVFSSNRDGDYEIYSLDPDTGTTVKLTDNSYTDKHPALSRDGTKIVFVSDQQIYTMNSDGSNMSSALAVLTGINDGNPSWNDDGTMIAYDNGYDIYVMNSDGTNKKNLTNTASYNEIRPSWRSGSGKIVYERSSDIYETDNEGTYHTKLTTAAFVIEGDPCLSPDGTKIVFTRKTTGYYSIYTMKLDATDLINVQTDVSADITSPAWSADGLRIAYVRSNAVYSKNADGTGDEKLLTDNGQDPSW